MELNVANWIESVREKPEHIRYRYVILCVVAGMLLVLGVWFLTVTEGFKSVSSDAGSAAEGVGSILPKPSDFSLDQVLQGKETLGNQEEPVSGQQYFEGQYQGKTPLRFDEEGVAPATREEVPATNPERP
ncbi:MAG: hypothetical protein ABI747_02505 [Candidatus Moraniibacteriota bacterium]